MNVQRGEISGWLTTSRAVALGAAVIIASTFAVYSNSLHAPFIFDDRLAIAENPTIKSLWPPWAPLLPPVESTGPVGRPIVNLSFALNYAIGGESVFGYHLTNLAIHIAAALVLFGLVRRTLLQGAVDRRFAESATLLAFAIAWLWALHPLQTESVTCIVQRTESLVGFFYLLTLYAFARAAHVDAGTNPHRWLALAFGACLLGMATKEVMVSAPLMALFYDRTFVAGGWREAWRRRWRWHLLLMSTWLLLAWCMASSRRRGGTVGFGLGVAWWEYALTQCRAILLYLKLSFWPHPLVLDYGNGIVRSFAAVLPQALMLVTFLLATAWAVVRRPALGFLGIWFFFILAPSSSVVPLVTQTIAEHRMYLPLAAVITATVLLLFRIMHRRSVAVCAVLAVAAASIAWRRNDWYRDEISIWRDTVMKQPDNPRAHYNLGVALGDTGNWQEAIAWYERAIALAPAYRDARYNLAGAYFHLGRPEEAIREYHSVLQINPDYAKAHYNLGVALRDVGDPGGAVRALTEAIRLKPDDAEARNNLGAVLLQLGRLAEARVEFEEALRLDPESSKAHTNLGTLLLREGNVTAAVTCFAQAAELQPESARAQSNLAYALARNGQVDEAITRYREALRLDPGFTAASEALNRLQGARGAASAGE